MHPVGFLSQPVVALGPARSRTERRNPSHQLTDIEASSVPDRNWLIYLERGLPACFRNRLHKHFARKMCSVRQRDCGSGLRHCAMIE
ncbi:hypothetical protein Kim5_CH03742 [Rhizobium sp. Kim5]|nr:hypothetical protein Kim5_CH03742 [Rhizobium sp. Kim5]